jgi:hypothetical protein
MERDKMIVFMGLALLFFVVAVVMYEKTECEELMLCIIALGLLFLVVGIIGGATLRDSVNGYDVFYFQYMQGYEETLKISVEEYNTFVYKAQRQRTRWGIASLYPKHVFDLKFIYYYQY